MPPDIVIGERGAVFVGIDDLTVRNEPELNERLKSVADAAHQSVASVEKSFRLLFDLRPAEERRDELARSVGLVSARKAAGDKYDLTLFDLLCEFLARTRDLVRRAVSYNEDLRLRARVLERFGGIVLAVRAGKYRNERFRFCRFQNACARKFLFVGIYGNFFLLFRNLRAVHRLQPALVYIGEFVERKFFLSVGNNLFFCGNAQKHSHFVFCRKLQNEGTVFITEDRLQRNGAVVSKTDLVAQAHFEYAFRNAAVNRRVRRNCFPLSQQIGHKHKILFQ